MEIISTLMGVLIILFVFGFFDNEDQEEIKIDHPDFQNNEDSQREYFSNMYALRETKKEHLRSCFWQQLKQKRAEIIGGYKCEACGKYTHKLDLHHVTYEHLTFEKIEDVRLLCRNCHNSLHKLLGYDRSTKYPIEVLQGLNNK